MTLVRVEKNKDNPYVILNKSFLEDPKISLKLKGFLAFCLTKPDHWQFHIRQLASTLKEGKDALYSTINEGIEYGYIEREQLKINGKFSTNNYIIRETKIKKISTVSGNPDADSSDAKTQTLVINECSDNENINTPIVPKGDMPSPKIEDPIKRQKIQEPKKEVAMSVNISERQEQSLLQKLNGNKERLQKAYNMLSEWKVSKGITKSINDYSAILKWVLRALEEKEEKAPENTVDKVKKWLNENVPLDIGNRLVQEREIILGKDYIEFPNTKDYHIKYTEPGAIPRIENNFRKMGIILKDNQKKMY